MTTKIGLNEYHRFLDEAGDTTFYGKGKIPIIGTEGVSNSFILGMVKFNNCLEELRNKVIELQQKIQNDEYYKGVPSLEKRKAKGGFYFHAKDDIPEIREQFFKFMKTLDCTFHAVVGQKNVQLYERKHNGRSNEFYADLLSHLIKDQLLDYDKLVLNIAQRKNSTEYHNLQSSLVKAKSHFRFINPEKQILTQINFNVQTYTVEPLFSIANYFCWSVQRVFEKGEIRFYNYLKEKIEIIEDIYNRNTNGDIICYNISNQLSENNKISPHLP
jgi:hypothetical protein